MVGYVGVGEVKSVAMSLRGVMQAVQFMMVEVMAILKSNQILSFSTYKLCAPWH